MSLRRIHLKDFVIVQSLDLDLGSGFTALTGETGAGKSILVDALQLALGARADAVVVREGATRADISAEFDCPDAARNWLETAGFDSDDTLLLRRVIDAQGKSKGWVNGSPATASQLRELGEVLVDIHGQHAWQSLMRPSAVRELLDDYGRIDSKPMQRAYANWHAAADALALARAAQSRSQTEGERLRWQLDEAAKLKPGADEWPLLNAEHAKVANAQALVDAATAALAALSEADDNATRLLNEATRQLAAQAGIDDTLGALSQQIIDAAAVVEDASHSLRAYIGKGGPDPRRLSELDDRISLWLGIARRMRCPPNELPALMASWSAQLAKLDAASDIESLLKVEQQTQSILRPEANKLSKMRQTAAEGLSNAVTAHMQTLGMAGGQFTVALLEQAVSANGAEEVEFRVAGHAGATPRAVGKVASGGELSRLSLAIAVTTSELGQADTLVFDEVDSGVGGAVAETVGRLMKQLGRHRQVLCVTHLPQVASAADHHGVVSKTANSTTGASSTVSIVSGETRVLEIARMLGGEKLSGTSIAHAKEMLGS